MENRLEKELGRLCREYAACSVEVERRDEARKVKKETYAKMGYTERLKLKTENPELYKQLAGK